MFVFLQFENLVKIKIEIESRRYNIDIHDNYCFFFSLRFVNRVEGTG